MATNILNQLKTIIAEQLDVNLKIEEIDETASLFEDGLGLDSIAVVELIALTEQHFEVEFAESDLNLESFSNLNVLASCIAQKIPASEQIIATA